MMLRSRPQGCRTVQHARAARGALVVAAFALAMGAASCSDSTNSSQAEQALTQEQCSYFAAGDRVTIAVILTADAA